MLVRPCEAQTRIVVVILDIDSMLTVSLSLTSCFRVVPTTRPPSTPSTSQASEPRALRPGSDDVLKEPPDRMIYLLSLPVHYSVLRRQLNTLDFLSARKGLNALIMHCVCRDPEGAWLALLLGSAPNPDSGGRFECSHSPQGVFHPWRSPVPSHTLVAAIPVQSHDRPTTVLVLRQERPQVSGSGCGMAPRAYISVGNSITLFTTWPSRSRRYLIITP